MKKNIYTDNEGFEFEIISQTIPIKKPIYGKKHSCRYSDILIYLLHVIDGTDAIYNLLLSLANYAIHNDGLSNKQKKMVDNFISEYEKAGIL